MTTRHTTSPRQWQAWGAAAILLSPATALAGSPGFIVSGLDAVPTEEGGEASFTVALAAKPGSDVFLDVTSSLVNEVTIVAEDPGPFTPLNWNTPRRYWAIGLDDEVEDGDAKVTVSVKAGPGSDGAYLAALATFDTENLDDERTLTFESDYVDCDGPKTEDIYDGRIVGLIYNRKLAQQDGAKQDWFDANPVQDDRVFAENSDKYYLSLRTLHVVLRNTYRKNMTNLETEGLLQNYARAAHEIHTTSRGMVELDFDQVALTTEFGDNSFIDDDPAPGVTAKFVDYPKLAFALAFAGYNYDEYDLISVSVAFTDDIPSHVRTEVAYAVPPPDFKYDVPFTNPETWKNDHTWTTVQYTTDPKASGWIDIFIHEMYHSLDWMHEYGSFPEARNPDDSWWLFTYDYEDVVDMFWARSKHDLLEIPPLWGKLEKRPATHIVEMSCPSVDVYKERRVYCPNGVECVTGCACLKEPSR